MSEFQKETVMLSVEYLNCVCRKRKKDRYVFLKFDTNSLEHPVYVHVSNKRYELVLVTIGGNATRMVKRWRKRGMA